MRMSVRVMVSSVVFICLKKFSVSRMVMMFVVMGKRLMICMFFGLCDGGEEMGD